MWGLLFINGLEISLLLVVPTLHSIGRACTDFLQRLPLSWGGAPLYLTPSVHVLTSFEGRQSCLWCSHFIVRWTWIWRPVTGDNTNLKDRTKWAPALSILLHQLVRKCILSNPVMKRNIMVSPMTLPFISRGKHFCIGKWKAVIVLDGKKRRREIEELSTFWMTLLLPWPRQTCLYAKNRGWCLSSWPKDFSNQCISEEGCRSSSRHLVYASHIP